MSQPVTPKPVVAPVYKPSLDKDELEKRVIAFQQQRSEAGSASAQYELGMRYLQGRGVDKDPSLARKWLTLSAAQGNTEAQIALAKLPPGSPSESGKGK
jgi:TPR repeat protein